MDANQQQQQQPAAQPQPQEGGLNCKCCGPNTAIYVTKSITVSGALAAGLFSTHEMIYYDDIRWHLIFFYLVALCIIILTAEFNLLRHRFFKAFAGFLSTPTGRGITYFFIGGLMILHDIWGTVIGSVMLTAGVINMFAWCFFPELKGEENKYIQQEVADQQQIERHRI